MTNEQIQNKIAANKIMLGEYVFSDGLNDHFEWDGKNAKH